MRFHHVLAGSVLTLGLVLPGSNLTAQRVQGSPSTASAQEPMPPLEADVPGQRDLSFSGKITSAGDRLVLYDKANRRTYQLDDQQLAKFFREKDVKVTGSLTAATHTIHISSIGLAR